MSFKMMRYYHSRCDFSLKLLSHSSGGNAGHDGDTVSLQDSVAFVGNVAHGKLFLAATFKGPRNS